MPGCQLCIGLLYIENIVVIQKAKSEDIATGL
jgi:hypothetical protein